MVKIGMGSCLEFFIIKLCELGGNACLQSFDKAKAKAIFVNRRNGLSTTATGAVRP